MKNICGSYLPFALCFLSSCWPRSRAHAEAKILKTTELREVKVWHKSDSTLQDVCCQWCLKREESRLALKTGLQTSTFLLRVVGMLVGKVGICWLVGCLVWLGRILPK